MAETLSEPREFSIDGMLFPMENGHPVLIEIDTEGDDRFLPVFPEVAELEAFMSTLPEIHHYRVKQIDDQFEFIDSLPMMIGKGRLRVAVNLRRMDDTGKLRWTEIQRGNA